MQPLNTETTPQSPFSATSTAENQSVLDALAFLEEKINDGKTLLRDLKVDTGLVHDVREYILNPAKALNQVTENLATAFVMIFWGMAKNNHSREVESMGYCVNGSKVSIWVYLKKDSYGFKARSDFYKLRSTLSNIPAFEKISVDFLVLATDEVELPEAYHPLSLV